MKSTARGSQGGSDKEREQQQKDKSQTGKDYGTMDQGKGQSRKGTT